LSVADPKSTTTDTTPKKGHPIGFWFFFWGELAERSSYYGMRAILALYMTERLGVAKSDAGTFMSLFIAACYFFPLIGGWVADNFLGKYWTIVLFSVPYVVAQFLVGIENQYVVGGTLLLLAMGSGVIKPNISTLMGLTYDQQRPGQDQLRTSAFSWFYMAINLGAVASQLSMPWLRDNYGYQVAFLFPAGLMSVALLVFALGKRFYANEVIVRKVLTEDVPNGGAEGRTLTGVPVRYEAVTAAEKQADSRLRWQTLGRLGSVFALIMFFWAIFDQSASTWIFFADTYMTDDLFGVRMRADAIQAFNGMFIVALVPLSVAFFKLFPMKATTKIGLGFAFTGLSMAIMSFAGFMAPPAQKVVKVTFPEGSLVVPDWATPLDKVTTGKGTYGTGVTFTATDWAYDAEKKKVTFASGSVTLADGSTLTVKDGHLTGTAGLTAPAGVLEPLLKSGDDLTAVKPDAAKVNVEQIDWTEPSKRVSIWWQVFAYLILTVAEILVSITGLELAFVAAPQSMKSFVTACFLAVVFLANLLINAPITRLYPTMSPGAYFAMLGGAMTVVVLVYIPIALQFNKVMAKKEADQKAVAEGKSETV
jgi:POT family proton-dependent oligopeptide transporter